MARPKDKDVKRLFALSGNRCAMPGCHTPIYDESGTATGELCHICAASVGGPRYNPGQSGVERHAFENLILLCRHHHAVVDGDTQTYTVDALQKIKDIHEAYAGAPDVADSDAVVRLLLGNWASVSIGQNSGNIAIGSPGAVQGQHVTVKTSRNSVSVAPPPGSIGSDVERTGYVQYLINRYNEFASDQEGRDRKFSYGALSRNLQAKFGTNWKLLPLARFDDGGAELHRRIDRTKIARINKGKGQASYSTFQEHLQKHG